MNHIEDAESHALWQRAQLHPITRQYLYHVPNGGNRNEREAARMKAMGVRAGVHDYHLPVAAGRYIGLWIELKPPKPHRSKVSDGQAQWLRKMQIAGHAAHIAYGWHQAWVLIEDYLALGVRMPAKEDAA